MVSQIYIVDDDEAVRDSLSFLLKTHGHEVQSFVDGEAFLKSDIRSILGIVLLDVRMPGRDGLEILTEALSVNPNVKVIMMSGHADVAMAVRALKKGALDFIEKPFQSAEILAALNRLKVQIVTEENATQDGEIMASKLAKLTPREVEVMGLLVEGKPNKIVASDLGLSVRTIETHRAHLLSKLEVKSLSDLVRIALSQNI